MPYWSINDQEDFGRYLARLTASAGFPFYWVENVKWLRFCQCFVPGAKPVKRRTLSSRLIPAECRQFREAAKIRLAGQEVTAQCDGWTGVNSHHIIAFMVTSASREVRHPHSGYRNSERISIVIVTGIYSPRI